MGVSIGPYSIIREGLVGHWDVGSPRSFRGEVVDNILNQVTQQYGTSFGTYIRTVSNTQNVYIPTVNKTVSTKVTDFYNDYGGGSGNCCPNIFTYGTGLNQALQTGTAVTGNTLYTYSIVYKTTTGSTNSNYMYRYEFNSSNGYLTEGGVHNDANRTSLGNGWYHAWGQFTSQPTVAYFNTYFFHYEYATYNTIYLASAQLIPGGRIMPAQYQIFNANSGRTRSSYYDINSVGTSEFNYSQPKPGGLMDLSGKGHHGEIRNGAYYDSDGGGSLVFDGSNDSVKIYDVNWLNCSLLTMIAWVKPLGSLSQNGFIFEKTTNGNVNTQYSYFFNGDGTFYFRTYTEDGNGHDYTFASSSYISLNQWNHIVATYDGYVKKVYVNGSLVKSENAYYGSLKSNNTGEAYIGIYGDGGYPLNGKIARVSVYDRALSASEISQDYNNTKGRFGL